MNAFPHSGPPTEWTVVCLCAEWCDTCREYRRLFDQRAARANDALHLWVDIEDDADVLGDLDIETFPTLLVLHGQRPRFFGPILPQIEVIDGLLRTLDPSATAAVPIPADNETAVRWLCEQAQRMR
jgi:thioredoxin-like negative regulator of GroEL